MTHHRKLLVAAMFSFVIGTLIVGMEPRFGRTENQANGASESAENQSRPNTEQAVKDPPIKNPTSKEQAEKSAVSAAQPSVAKEVEKTKFKVITMAEAVTIAERAGRGYALKAERKDRPDVSFKIDVMGIDGIKTKIELSAEGKILLTSKGSDMKNEPEKKGKGGKRTERSN